MEYYRDASLNQDASFETMTTSRNGASMFSGRTGSRRKKDPVDEAMLLSQATSQAMIAARSIVLSGGSQQTALSTAKAAAQSILAPQISDSDSVAMTGQTFLGRRKGKRQAEIVASMALLSVNNSLQQFKQGVNASQQFDATMLVRQPPPAQVVPMQQSMHSPVDDESLTIATLATNSLLSENPAESFRNVSSNKFSRRFQKESSSNPTAYREVAGRDQPEIRGKDSPRQRSGRDTRLIESPRSKRIPSSLPDRNQTERSRIGPMYTYDVLERKKERVSAPLSYSTDEDDDSTAGDGETTTSSNAEAADPIIAAKRKSIDRGFLKKNVDPLLFSITSAFNCGFSPSTTIAAGKKTQKQVKRQFRDDVAEDGDSDDEDFHETRDEGEKEVVTSAVILGRAVDSESSVESAEIIRELNVDTDSTNERDDYYARKKEKHRNAARKEKARQLATTASVEEVVLRALSIRGDQKIEPKQPAGESRNDLISISRYNRNDEIFTGVHSNPSRVERPSLRVLTGAPGEPDFQTHEKPFQSRKSRLFQSFIRNRNKGRGATAAETPE